MAVPDSRIQLIKETGFDAWFAEQKQQAQIWVDPQLQTASGQAPTAG
jgi:hypothetical protein